MRSFKVEKVLHADPAVVFKMFSKAMLLEQWFFPPAASVVKSDLVFRAGGSYFFGMAVPDKPTVWGRLDFEAITEPSSIVFVQSVTDADGHVISPLPGSDWLLRLRSDIRLQRHPDGTIMRQSISPFGSGPDEQGFVEYTWGDLHAEYQGALNRLGNLFEHATH